MSTHTPTRSAFPSAAAAVVLTLSGCAVTAAPPAPSDRPPDGVMCTQDVMQCPDGRYVGRTPPGCRFVCAPPTSR